MNPYAALSLGLLIVAQAAPPVPEPPPLTEEQVIRLRELVRTTQEAATSLQAQLDGKQQQLARVYAQYELNERQASKLQAEIMQLQQQLLANHHRMQTELRTIVAKERFEMIHRRLAYALNPAKKDPEPPPTRPK